jgi:hypothetical protein
MSVGSPVKDAIMKLVHDLDVDKWATRVDTQAILGPSGSCRFLDILVFCIIAARWPFPKTPLWSLKSCCMKQYIWWLYPFFFDHLYLSFAASAGRFLQ